MSVAEEAPLRKREVAQPSIDNTLSLRYVGDNETGVELGELLVDGVHPNDRGYDVMYELICDALGLAE